MGCDVRIDDGDTNIEIVRSLAMCPPLRFFQKKMYILTDKSREYCDSSCNFSYCTYVALIKNKKDFLCMPLSKMYQ